MEAGNLESPMKLVDIANGTAENGHNVLSHRILSSRLRNNALEIVTLGATKRKAKQRAPPSYHSTFFLYDYRQRSAALPEVLLPFCLGMRTVDSPSGPPPATVRRGGWERRFAGLHGVWGVWIEEHGDCARQASTS